MPSNVLIIVHQKINALVTKRLLRGNGRVVNSIDIPALDKSPEIEEYSDYQVKQFGIIAEVCNQHSNIAPDIIILESNYGRPAQSIFCAALYELLVDFFPMAQFVVCSMTAGSIISALEYNRSITAINLELSLSKDQKYTQCSSDITARIFSQLEMMARIKALDVIGDETKLEELVESEQVVPPEVISEGNAEAESPAKSFESLPSKLEDGFSLLDLDIAKTKLFAFKQRGTSGTTDERGAGASPRQTDERWISEKYACCPHS